MTLKLDKTEWKRFTLGEVAGASKESVDPRDGSVDRYIAGEHMDSDDLKIHRWGVVGEVDLGPAFHRRVRPGQVLYGSRRTYLRKVAVADFDGVCANTTFAVEPKDETVLLQEFLPFLMTAEPFHAFAIKESKGSVNPYVNWSDIERYEVDLPPIDEQKCLADLLWAIERHRRALAVELKHLAAAQSIWLETSLLAGADRDEWTVRRISDLVTAGPSNGKSATANDEQRGVPTLSISAIRDGRVLGGAAVKYMDVPPSEVCSFLIEKGDFLIVRGNGNKHLTGRGGIAGGGLPDGCVYPDLLIRLRFDPAVILPAFAAAQWNSEVAHRALIRKAKSTNGIWKIDGKDIKSHELVVPPLHQQRALLHEMESFNTAATSVHAAVDALAAVRSSLLADIFRGS